MTEKNPIHILAVEDSPATGTSLSAFISMFGCVPSIETNAEDALKKLESGYLPDIIILDFKLPRMSGTTFLNLLRKSAKWKDIPVIPFTSQAHAYEKTGLDESKKLLDEFYKSLFFNKCVSGAPIEPYEKPDGNPNTKEIPMELAISIAVMLIYKNLPLPHKLEKHIHHKTHMTPEIFQENAKIILDKLKNLRTS